MNAERIAASRKYAAALSTVRRVEMGGDVAAWQAADAALTLARNALVAAEMRHPTKQEVARERRLIEMSNRGLRN